MGGGRGSSCSSGEEDGDADWRAAIDSVAATSSTDLSRSNCNDGLLSAYNGSISASIDQSEALASTKSPHSLNHYQIKAQKLLDEILEKSIEIVKVPSSEPIGYTATREDGIRLFKKSPAGILFDHSDDPQGPRKKPRILPGKEINEKSKKFRRQLQSVAVSGFKLMVAAEEARQKALAKLEAKDAAAKVKAKREEERVAELKRIRGERWLPSIAREMQVAKKSTSD